MNNAARVFDCCDATNDVFKSIMEHANCLSKDEMKIFTSMAINGPILEKDLHAERFSILERSLSDHVIKSFKPVLFEQAPRYIESLRSNHSCSLLASTYDFELFFIGDLGIYLSHFRYANVYYEARLTYPSLPM